MRATLTVPRADVAIVASGGTIIERTGAPSARRVIAHAALGQALGLSWSRQRATNGPALPVRLRGQLQHVVGLGEETALVTARVTVEVLRGGASAFTLRVPDGLVVNQVQGAHVADWDVQGAALTITLLDRVDRQVAVIVSGEFRPPASGRIEVPLLHLADAERESGAVAVEVLGAGEVTKHEARGLDPTDPTDLGDLLSGRVSPAIVAFRYRGDRPDAERALALTLTRYAPQEVLLAAVDEARYRAIVSEDGKALVEGRLAVRNNQRSFLALTLPGGRDVVERRRRRPPGAARHRAEGQRPRAAAEASRRQRRGAGHRRPDVRGHGGGVGPVGGVAADAAGDRPAGAADGADGEALAALPADAAAERLPRPGERAAAVGRAAARRREGRPSGRTGRARVRRA